MEIAAKCWDLDLVDKEPRREITFLFLSMEGIKAYNNLDKKGEKGLICLKISLA